MFSAACYRATNAFLRYLDAEPTMSWKTATILLVFSLAPKANGQTHSYVNYMRSGSETYVFVQQGVEGEYGKHTAAVKEIGSDGQETQKDVSQYWKGYGIVTSVGLELLRFVQFVAGHTFVNMRYKDDALESLNGSRITAGMRLVFSAPVANLEAGAGLLGSRLDYQKQLQNASYYGSGNYYSLGLNYFLSSKISFYYEAKLESEHLVRNGGSSLTEAIDTNMTLMGLGFRIWL